MLNLYNIMMKTQFVKKNTSAKQYYEKQPGIIRTLSSKYYVGTGNEGLDTLIVGYEIGTLTCVKQCNTTSDHAIMMAYSLSEGLYSNQKCIVVGKPISQMPAQSAISQTAEEENPMKIAWRYNDASQKQVVTYKYDMMKQIEKDKENQIIYLKADGKSLKELFVEIVSAMQSSLKYIY